MHPCCGMGMGCKDPSGLGGFDHKGAKIEASAGSYVFLPQGGSVVKHTISHSLLRGPKSEEFYL